MLRKDKKIKAAFGKVKDEFDQHLDAINANTQEILENRAMILEMQERLCKLSDQIAEVQLMLEDTEPDRLYSQTFDLTLREKEVFLVLYTAPDVLSYADISRTISLPVALVDEIINSLCMKGVSVVFQKNDRGTTFVSIDPQFRELQSKENILRLDETISKHLSKDFQLSLFD